jgi:hypothetical protein
MSLRLAAVAGAAGLLLLGGFLWSRWGTLVWLDSAIAYCF